MRIAYVPARPPLSALGRSLALGLALVVALAVLPMAGPVAQQAGENAAHALAPLGQLPLAFVPNEGQADGTVQFQAQSLGGTLFFTPQEVVLHPAGTRPPAAAQQPAATVRLGFVDANPAPTITASQPLPGRVNDLRGDDPAQWRTDLPTYAAIVYHDLYAGIDLQYDGQDGTLKGTYTVAPGVDPQQIRWRYRGVEQVGVDSATGDLRIPVAPDQVLTEAAPVAWQNIGDQRVPVHARYHLAADGAISFALGVYNVAYPLVIDPTIEWSTYLGGMFGDAAHGIAVDQAGYVYVAGFTFSDDFPVKAALQPKPAFGNCGVLGERGECSDAFVTKLSPDGRTIIYSTFLGERDMSETGHDLAVDAQGNVYLLLERTWPNLHPDPEAPALFDDVLVVKLNAAGSSIAYRTKVGGSAMGDRAGGIAVDHAGNAYLAGTTQSADFLIMHALQPTLQGPQDAFLAKLDAAGTIAYSTFLGGSATDGGTDIAVDATGTAYVTGDTNSSDFPTRRALQPHIGGGNCGDAEVPHVCSDAFVTVVHADGQTLVYSTYLGGTASDVGHGIAIDSAGKAYLAGGTTSSDFPTTHAFQLTFGGGDCDDQPEVVRACADAFIAKFHRTGAAVVYSTYLGGSRDDAAYAIVVDRAGNAYLTGATTSVDFPTWRAAQPQGGGGSCGGQGLAAAPCADAFVAKLDMRGTALRYATYLGGSASEDGRALAVDRTGGAYVVGATLSDDFPTNAALQPQRGDVGFGDAFVTKLSDEAGAP